MIVIPKMERLIDRERQRNFLLLTHLLPPTHSFAMSMELEIQDVYNSQSFYVVMCLEMYWKWKNCEKLIRETPIHNVGDSTIRGTKLKCFANSFKQNRLFYMKHEKIDENFWNWQKMYAFHWDNVRTMGKTSVLYSCTCTASTWLHFVLCACLDWLATWLASSMANGLISCTID